MSDAPKRPSLRRVGVPLMGLLLALSLPVREGIAQQGSQPALPAPSFAAHSFKYEGDKPVKEHVWRRPSEVEYILVAGCGGGGGGSAGVMFSGEHLFAGPALGRGFGGHAGEWRTVLLGPLKADSYKVEVGRAGLGGVGARKITRNPQPGAASRFSGEDASIDFPAGAAATFVVPKPSQYTKVPLEGERGASGPFGTTSGGAPGGQNANGGTASFYCAGGGGSGKGAPKLTLAGGNGSPGFVLLYPLPDLARLFDLLSAGDGRTPPPTR